jgi:hypothetical protein
MRVLTVATSVKGYFHLLRETTDRWGYDLHVLGWKQDWKGFAWKLVLYKEALQKVASNEPVICVDGYDVVAIAPSQEIERKFRASESPLVFSGQRYFPNQRWVQRFVDQVMSDDIQETITEKTSHARDYSRPCMGLLIGYSADLLRLFKKLIEIEKRRGTNDDQTLLNLHYLRHPDAIQVDTACTMFQNLWRTRGRLYGKIVPTDKHSEIEVYFDDAVDAFRVRNKAHQTSPCFLHAPFNLDINPVLKALKLDPPVLNYSKGWEYLRYSVLHHAKRAIGLYQPFKFRRTWRNGLPYSE